MRLPPPITSRTNERVKALRASLSGEARRPGDLLGLEGSNLIYEAHAAGYDFDTLFLREGSEMLLEQKRWLNDLRAQSQVVLGRDLFDRAVTTRSPQGVAATCLLRELEPRTDPSTNALILEDVQDPGNFGTLLRSAESFGVPRVMVTPGTANQWSPKVMRAGAGAVLRTPVQRGPVQVLLGQLRAEGTRIFAAVAHFAASVETAGPHHVLAGRASNPDAPGGRRYQPLETETGSASSFSYGTHFQHPCAILVGNEGAGLSEAALAMADEQVMIPGGGSESLNAAVAGSILMYESMRQTALRVSTRNQGRRP